MRRRAFARLTIGLVLCGSGMGGSACGSRHQAEQPPTRTERSSATVAAPAAGGNGPAWTEVKARRRVAGSVIHVNGRRFAIDGATVACWGAGPAGIRAAVRVWARFDCVAPTFVGAAAGPDLLFVLVPTGRTSFDVRDARLSQY